MRALLDTDVLLDLFLDRESFAETAAALWEANERGDFEDYISAITPINLFYITRKLKDLTTARQAVAELVATLRICSVDQETLQSALSLPLADYEDAVQLASAIINQVDVIVTRNLEDYTGATLPVFSPKDFLKKLYPTT